MLVRFLKTVATQKKLYKKGQVLDIDTKEGTSFCKIGYCEPVVETKKKETAISKAATKRTTRKK